MPNPREYPFAPGDGRNSSSFISLILGKGAGPEAFCLDNTLPPIKLLNSTPENTGVSPLQAGSRCTLHFLVGRGGLVSP